MRTYKNHRGSVGPIHNTVQNELVDILERKGRKVKKECAVWSRTDENAEWIVDVADLTDPAHPIYYEVQKGTNPSFEAKRREFAHHVGVDMVAIYIDEMRKSPGKNNKPLGKNPGILDLRRWLEDKVI